MCLVPLFLHEQRISCGKCPECLDMLRADWVYRCQREAADHKHNYFLTLTFDSAHLPDTESGVWDAFTAFRKSVHKDIGKFSYFVSLELGEQKGRYHLHLLWFSDKPIPKPFIRQHWRNGFIKRSLVNLKRIRYTTVYMFSPDPLNKVKRYRSSNGLGGKPLLPFRVRRRRSGVIESVPLPRYYCKKFPEAKRFAQQYYENLYHEQDFGVVYTQCRERWNKRRFGFGKSVLRMQYEEFLLQFLQQRVRRYKTFNDPRDLIAFPGPDSYRGLNRTYTQLLRRVEPYFALYGDRRSGNLKRYLIIDCPMSLRDAAKKIALSVKRPFLFVRRCDLIKKQLTFLP